VTGDNLADLRIRVQPGAGVVAVLGGVLLVVPSLRAEQEAALEALLEAARSAEVVRAVARVVADHDDRRLPPFCLVVEGDRGGTFALVHGEVVLEATGGGIELRLAGREARSWVDRALPEDLERLTVTASDAGPAVDDAFADLRSGVVRGGGVLATRRSAAPPASGQAAGPPSQQAAEQAPRLQQATWSSAPAPDAPVPEPVADVPIPEPVADAPIPEPLASPAPIGAHLDDAEAAQPLTQIVAPPLGLGTAARPPVPTGFDPFAQPTPQPPAGGPPEDDAPAPPDVPGPPPSPVDDVEPTILQRAVSGSVLSEPADADGRPGRLFVDDGLDVLVDRDCVIGRNPEADPDVARGVAKGVRLQDAEQRISRVHARLVLGDGDASIVDEGSVNGTWIEPPGSGGWIAVPPDVLTPLPLGSRIQVGDVVLAYAADPAAG
jgi:hypothetical protein